jgi:hypothetical protein
MTAFELTPNFRQIFRGMLREARRNGRALFESLKLPEELEALREVQRFLSPLSMAAHTMLSPVEVEAFRTALGEIVESIAKTISEIETDLAEDENDDGDAAFDAATDDSIDEG